MKFKKLILEESRFDDDLYISKQENTYDDDFSNPEYMPEMNDDKPLPGPRIGSDSGVADLLINSINDEWDAIRQYNSLVVTLQSEAASNPIYSSFVDVINDITEEENKHVGQLQEMLKQISPNAASIDEGEVEGKTQLLKNGVLQVQSWNSLTSKDNEINTTNVVTETCDLIDVDDEM